MKNCAKIIAALPSNSKCRALSKTYNISGGFKRIYFYHIRKTGGTSINTFFLSLGGNGSDAHRKLIKTKIGRIITNDKVIVGGNKHLIEKGDFFYAYSHIPAHQLRLPAKTFTFTILRDPASRVLSHYKMLLNIQQKIPSSPLMKTEGKWLGKGFGDFLSRIPKEHLLRQIYMFSASYDINEAFNRITNCSHFFFLEDFSQGIAELASKLELQIEERHRHKSFRNLDLKPNELALLRSKLEPEYELIAKLKNH